ncbi:MAG TPA: hypothetical protein PLS90_11265 [Candidatus Sumerlaeota bacterium]|nr:hypothetical protein [Candidatus Sumerlaeota bacterium]HOR29573.1 hypothetical protein [Candidatus Sumerlaeota bacterium]HPK03025.1 hypothetical protein [Candidatus Sumerlaeota bacterium]
MFWILVLLLFIGILFFLMEILLPYGLSFLAGVIVIGFGAWLAFRHFDPGLGMLYLLAAGLISGGAAWWLFSSGERLLALPPPSPDTAPPPQADTDRRPPIGALVDVVQPLRPTGTILWNGRRHAARSLIQEAESPIGARVRVTDYDSTFVVVEPLRDDPARPEPPPHA